MDHISFEFFIIIVILPYPFEGIFFLISCYFNLCFRD